MTSEVDNQSKRQLARFVAYIVNSSKDNLPLIVDNMINNKQFNNNSM